MAYLVQSSPKTSQLRKHSKRSTFANGKRYTTYMSLFSDMFSVVNELNDLKNEAVSSVGDVAKELTGLKDEVSGSVSGVSDEIKGLKDEVLKTGSEIKNNIVS